MAATDITDGEEAEDRARLTAAIGGDRTAIEGLLRDNYDRIYTLCRRMCTSREQAEDATQNALISIVRGLSRFDQRSRFSTWCYRIASNAAIDQLRRDGRRAADSLDSMPGEPGAAQMDTTADQRLSSPPDEAPDQHVISAETSDVLASALEDLDERFRVPMVLRDVAQMDYAEIAEVLEIPPGTVRSRIARGREAMRRALTGTDLDPTTHGSGLSARSAEGGLGDNDAEGTGNRTPTQNVEMER